jgi:hypothetical protein
LGEGFGARPEWRSGENGEDGGGEAGTSQSLPLPLLAARDKRLRWAAALVLASDARLDEASRLVREPEDFLLVDTGAGRPRRLRREALVRFFAAVDDDTAALAAVVEMALPVVRLMLPAMLRIFLTGEFLAGRLRRLG